MVTDRDCDSIAAQNQLSSPLLRLPAELRNRIYKEVFASRIARVVPRSVIKGYTTCPFTALHVCRQVRHEAKPIMFASITFDFRALEPIVDPAAILTLGSFEAIVVGSKLVCAVFVEAALDVSTLAREVARVESVRRVKDLQRQLSHFAQYGQWNSISQLFSINSTLIWGNVTAHGPASIETWLRNDSGNMNGLVSGSLSTMIVETPVVSLSIDGKRAKGRWNGIWFQGDGKGGTRIQGGVYENEYILMDNRWHISLLHYYDMYKGDYENGWRNVDGKGISIVPYHFTAEGSGLPIPPAVGDPEPYNGTIEQLGARIQRLNDEDDVRNLMHAHGYYVDRRMWSDVVDLHTANTTVRIGNETTLRGKTGVRQFLKRMGPEGLTQGVNNDHPIFDMIVEVEENGREAIARGTEIAMLGDVNRQVASWEFNVFRNRIVKENGVWKVQDIVVAPQIVADYYIGWGQGGLKPSDAVVPPFLNVTSSPVAEGSTTRSTNVTVNDLKRRLRRSAACDGSENLSHAYGYYADDILGKQLGELFAKNGHKASPFAGFFHTPERITGAMKASYGTNRSALRSSISFHWRLQPVIIVSEDGRSASLRARLLQPSTSVNKAGSFNSAIYQDQIVSENGKWKFWSVTIDEFYWQSSSWKSGWSMVTQQNSTQPDPPAWTRRYPPDLTIADVGERESTFRGGSGQFIQWPEIQRMWFGYRNSVSGRKPEWYWPGCVPCGVRPDWSLEANGWQEP